MKNNLVEDYQVVSPQSEEDLSLEYAENENFKINHDAEVDDNILENNIDQNALEENLSLGDESEIIENNNTDEDISNSSNSEEVSS